MSLSLETQQKLHLKFQGIDKFTYFYPVGQILYGMNWLFTFFEKKCNRLNICLGVYLTRNKKTKRKTVLGLSYC